MTTRDSSSGAKSSMDNFNHKSPTKRTVSPIAVFDQDEEANYSEVWAQLRRGIREVKTAMDYIVSPTAVFDQDEEADDSEVWDQYHRMIHEAQSILDRTRSMIQQVNDNCQSQIPENMVKNVALKQEIKGNISQSVSLFADITSDFSTFVLHDKGGGNTEDGGAKPNN